MPQLLFASVETMLRIAICDDIIDHSAYLHELLIKELGSSFLCEEYSDSDQLRGALAKGIYYDLFFLDIELGRDSGITLAREINSRYPKTLIVFVTANIVNAVEAGEADHVYFLTKPVDRAKLHMALNRVRYRMGLQTDKRLLVSLRGGGNAVVSSGQIIYCERTKRTTTLVLEDQVLYSSVPLDDLESELSTVVFSRPHNSFLVNLMHVSKLERTMVYLDNGATLSVSNQRRISFRMALAAYISES